MTANTYYNMRHTVVIFFFSSSNLPVNFFLRDNNIPANTLQKKYTYAVTHERRARNTMRTYARTPLALFSHLSRDITVFFSSASLVDVIITACTTRRASTSITELRVDARRRRHREFDESREVASIGTGWVKS